ncbi:hypothetical protein [Lysobacter gummosus]|uniref:hypothetical protein n=1 Tax=Lysobacter gummosus TaxID=262324 RepID=UPI00363B148B
MGVPAIGLEGELRLEVRQRRCGRGGGNLGDGIAHDQLRRGKDDALIVGSARLRHHWQDCHTSIKSCRSPPPCSASPRAPPRRPARRSIRAWRCWPTKACARSNFPARRKCSGWRGRN